MLSEYSRVQKIAKDTIEYIKEEKVNIEQETKENNVSAQNVNENQELNDNQLSSQPINL